MAFAVSEHLSDSLELPSPPPELDQALETEQPEVLRSVDAGLMTPEAVVALRGVLNADYLRYRREGGLYSTDWPLFQVSVDLGATQEDLAIKNPVHFRAICRLLRWFNCPAALGWDRRDNVPYGARPFLVAGNLRPCGSRSGATGSMECHAPA